MFLNPISLNKGCRYNTCQIASAILINSLSVVDRLGIPFYVFELQEIIDVPKKTQCPPIECLVNGSPAQLLSEYDITLSEPPFPSIKPNVDVAYKYPKHLIILSQLKLIGDEKCVGRQLTANAMPSLVLTITNIRAPTSSLYN